MKMKRPRNAQIREEVVPYGQALPSTIFDATLRRQSLEFWPETHIQSTLNVEFRKTTLIYRSNLVS